MGLPAKYLMIRKLKICSVVCLIEAMKLKYDKQIIKNQGNFLKNLR